MSKLKLALVLDLIDKVTSPAKAAQGALGKLNQQTKKLDGLKKLNDKLGVSGQKLDASKQKLAELGRQMAATANPSATLTRQFQAAQRQTQRLQQSHRELRDRARETRTALRAEGVDTRNLAQAQERLQAQIAQTTAQLQRQQRVMQNVSAARANVTEGFQQMGTGVAGVVGASFAIRSMMAPVKEMQAALGEVQSLDVEGSSLTTEVMKGLQEKALQFSTQYGASAADFVASSYDIQSAIAGLKGDDLGNFTKASAVLAMGTKANVGVITGYVGKMYSFFNDEAKKMGNTKWVEQLTGKTALAVKLFTTDGKKMADSFSGVGPAANMAGISMSEQMAILGQLNNSYEGGQSGTKYAAFLKGIGKAQDKLGLKFTDSAGKMLSMPDILEKINNKYTDLGRVETSDLLQKAFGTTEAVDVIKALSKDMGGLKSNIIKISAVKGNEDVSKMAEAIADPWDKADAGFKALQISLGDILLPTILEGLNAINSMTGGIRAMATEFPGIAKVISLAVLGVIGLVAGFSTLSIIIGASKFVLAGWKAVMAISSAAQWAWNAAQNAGGLAGARNMAITGAMAIKQKALAAWTVIMTAGQWAWNAALSANPIGLVIAGVAALAAGAVYLYNNWDAVMSWFNDKLQWLADKFSFLGDMWNGLFGDNKATTEITQKIKQVSDKVPVKSADIPALQANIKGSDIMAPKVRPSAPMGGNVSQQQTQNNPISITINAAPGMDAKQVAQLVQQQLEEKQRQQQSNARSNMYDTP